ncbi:hypothetical protein F7725_016345 [Dissostichus mawsoni]|uniref:Uncharacterized protein n=1 Tax=Dissostichus mawsoni TaxID=36200 RepID=A0A7J5Z1C9_DISMA|nr:hypothetical protein F7725_016345 [Dissostichus mawsoni]
MLPKGQVRSGSGQGQVRVRSGSGSGQGQMLGFPLPGSAGRSPGGRAGRERSCLEVECVRREGRVVQRQFEVVRVHVLVERSHDGTGVVGVLQTQRMTQLVHRHQEQVITCRQRRGGVKDVCPPAIKMFDIAAMKPVSQAALNYLEEWYDFTDNNYQKNVASLALKSKFTFSHLCDAVEVLQIRGKLDMDELYDEYCVTLPRQQDVVERRAPVVEKWSTLLQGTNTPSVSRLITAACLQQRQKTKRFKSKWGGVEEKEERKDEGENPA